jgi:hypothetical protein
MSSWIKKTRNKTIPRSENFLAPEWYVSMKNSGATLQELFEAVKKFCSKTMPNEKIDDDFVELMISTYEI